MKNIVLEKQMEFCVNYTNRAVYMKEKIYFLNFK